MLYREKSINLWPVYVYCNSPTYMQVCGNYPVEKCETVVKQNCQDVPVQNCSQQCQDIYWCKECVVG